MLFSNFGTQSARINALTEDPRRVVSPEQVAVFVAASLESSRQETSFQWLTIENQLQIGFQGCAIKSIE